MTNIAADSDTKMIDIDHIVPFHVEPLDVRGRAVQLGPMVDTILKRHNYPKSVSKLLGEVIVLTSLLGSSLKFDGKFIVQTQTDGPVSLLVVDFTTPGNIRAYADFDLARIEQAEKSDTTSSEELLGKGTLAMTVDQGGHMQRYQGIVALDGKSLEDVAQAYFKQSEQIPTHVRLAVAETLTPSDNAKGSNHAWRAGGLLVQFLPESVDQLTTRDLPGGDVPDAALKGESDERHDLWIEAKALVETTSDDELTDPEIDSSILLYRLFHEHGVLVYEGTQMVDKCSCSKERLVSVIATMSEEERAETLTDGQAHSTCDFCSANYVITTQDFS